MPAPERPRADQRDQDLAAIPSFLRDAPHQRATPTRDPDASLAPRALAIPRPVTPASITADAQPAPALDPASLPMPSLSRRRVVTVAGVLLAGVLILTFARQVSEATAASNRAAELRTANAALREEVARLERDLGQVQDVRFIRLEGRAYGLGGPGEIPFALAAGAGPLAADAPGSASVRLGAEQHPRSPLDAWLEVLFGSSP
jgi:hypothetical protein